jgi:hypothetical protein
MKLFTLHDRKWLLAASSSLLLIVSGCSTPPVAVAPEPKSVMAAPIVLVSLADSAQGYRMDAASHLYDKNSSRIFKGIMPPFLYAIAVLQVDVDSQGQLTALSWMRPPLHAPEVVAEIERTVRQAMPFPAPVKLGRASYIETWLWDASGRFQLHTLTEGQSWVVSGSGIPLLAKP